MEEQHNGVRLWDVLEKTSSLPREERIKEVAKVVEQIRKERKEKEEQEKQKELPST